MKNHLKKSFKQYVIAVLGLVLIIAYWIHLHPPGWSSMGYGEDLGGIEITRTLMADSLARFGHPAFTTTRMMAPEGGSMAFCSWSLERDWLGGLFYLWAPQFPFLWVYLGFSLLASYLIVGLISRKMGLPTAAAWTLAIVSVLLHAPRHFKALHHFEHLTLHWTYAGLFLDAWIWKRAFRDRNPSLKLEIWRVFCLLGIFSVGGYYWGPMILEWVMVRAGLAVLTRQGLKWKIEAKGLALPALFCIGIFGIELAWFLPLLSQVRDLGRVSQVYSEAASLNQIFEPLGLQNWLRAAENFFPRTGAYLTRMLDKNEFLPLDRFETVVTIGWTYLLPLSVALFWIPKKKGGKGIGAILPHLLFYLFIVSYSLSGAPFRIQRVVQTFIPFMAFFRIASRMGLWMPQTVAAILALSWPELSSGTARIFAYFRAKRRESVLERALGWGALGCVGLVLIMEWSVLALPITSMPALNSETEEILLKIRNEPGTTVLNLPFCMGGGNRVCLDRQCPNYPDSIAASYFTHWHQKAVYGFYQARNTPAQCDQYDQSPYPHWFEAWKSDRCFSALEWQEFCGYLAKHPELSAVLVFPDIWKGAGNPACQAEFNQRLGPPLGESRFFTGATPGGEGKNLTRMQWYSAQNCRTK
jgi:hypothetical protein